MSDRWPRLALVLIALAAVLTAAGVWIRKKSPPPPAAPGPATSPQQRNELQDLARQLEELETREAAVAKSVFSQELLAQECGRVFEDLWNTINRATNRLSALEDFPVPSLVPPRFDSPKPLPLDVTLFQPDGAGTTLDSAGWRAFLRSVAEAGWELGAVEIRHLRFDPDTSGRPDQSTFYVAAHLDDRRHERRAVVEGDIQVRWRVQDSGTRPAVERIDASRLQVRMRSGPPAFRLATTAEVTPPEGSFFIDPMILHDLDGDGLSELILASANLVIRRQGERYVSEPLCQDPPGLIFTALVADFDRDGFADYLCARHDGLILYRGSGKTSFDTPGLPVWTANPRLRYAQVLSCGDVDGDGDLDVWLGQYKVPYERGQMPHPFHDANDGHPSSLLRNDGRGNFSEATAESGLAQKRWRRAYSGSFCDLDDDGDLDFVQVSDFAGLDVYVNDGRGRFTDVTRDWLAEWRGFGMAHALADFNRDGRLDLLMIGMNSPTADRLNHLRIVRPGFEEHDAWRGAMTYGNRLYLGRSTPGFDTAPSNDSIARAGWAWGVGTPDFDNDGLPDVYVANGHETNESVRDYEPEFWLHDIYVGDSRDHVVKLAYFGGKIQNTRGRGHSYGGYERNRLYWNRGNASFLDVGHLMGVALPEDCRNVVADDLDGDGRVDLLVTTFRAWPQKRQTVEIYRNVLPTPGNWVGFRLRDQPGSPSPVGTRITVRTKSGPLTRVVVTGDSYRSQHPFSLHFGLGPDPSIESVTVRWPGRPPEELAPPALNRWHTLPPPR